MSRETLGTGTYDDRDRRLERVLERVTDYEMLNKRVTSVQECRCWDIKARCYVTKERLFGRKCIKVNAQREGIRDPVIKKTFYFIPKHYTLWQLKR